jgi:glycosyltransferase involved in cell wall biosynthesis
MVSVCMPMARSSGDVERSVRSVLAQDHEDFELLIGDETGAGAELIAALDDPRIRYHHNPTRLGFAQNHVALLDRAAGRYLAVLHDDDYWEPQYLSHMVHVLDRHDDVGLACCRIMLDRGDGRPPGAWPWPLPPGRTDNLLPVVLREEWFLLLSNMVFRRQVWNGPARRWPELCCADLQFFLSAADAGWPLYFLDSPLASYSLHRDQSGAWRGQDNGLAVADDVLAFWAGWLAGRPADEIALTARQRARWQLRRARALLLAGHTAPARRAVAEAEALAGRDLPDRRRLKLAAALPNPVVRGAVRLKRAVTDTVSDRLATRVTTRGTGHVTGPPP